MVLNEFNQFQLVFVSVQRHTNAWETSLMLLSNIFLTLPLSLSPLSITCYFLCISLLSLRLSISHSSCPISLSLSLSISPTTPLSLPHSLCVSLFLPLPPLSLSLSLSRSFPLPPSLYVIIYMILKCWFQHFYVSTYFLIHSRTFLK